MFIYVISTDYREKPVKIGKANNPEKRLKSLQTGNADKLHIKHLIKCKSDKQAISIEMELHKKLSKYRINGEWFSPEGLGKFRKVCNSMFVLMLPKHTDSKMACWEVGK